LPSQIEKRCCYPVGREIDATRRRSRSQRRTSIEVNQFRWNAFLGEIAFFLSNEDRRRRSDFEDPSLDRFSPGDRASDERHHNNRNSQ